jgi:hypothetical protein
MPNWCNNTLFVEGDLNALTDFKKRVLKVNEHNTINFTMEDLMPTPSELLEQTSPAMWRGDENDEDGKKEFEKQLDELKEKYGYTDWYNWRVDNWGTKWDTAESEVDEMDGKSLIVHYNTAWGPNDGFVKFASKVYPSLKFRLSYEEPGMGFCGILICKDGEVDIEDQDDLQWADEYDNLVEWDNEKERWFIIETNEVIDDEDFYPMEYNVFNH